MTREEMSHFVSDFRRKIKEMHPENCPFCGGCHQIRVRRTSGEPEFGPLCCDDMLRSVQKAKRELLMRFQEKQCDE